MIIDPNGSIGVFIESIFSQSTVGVNVFVTSIIEFKTKSSVRAAGRCITIVCLVGPSAYKASLDICLAYFHGPKQTNRL